MKVPFLTVMTTPVVPGNRRMYQRVRSALRPLLKPGTPLPATSPYPGHYAVTRSVVEGLRRVGADFNFNPRALGEVARVVYAPANEALRQAAEWKRAGTIDCLVAGPVNALSPSEEGGVLMLPEIDCLMVASDWVRELYRDAAPSLVAKCRTCPSGVDPTAWMPSAAPQRRRGIVFWKSGSEAQCVAVEQAVERHGWDPLRIRYGSYDATTYRQALDGAAVAVFLSAFETQGLALAESWAMNVPTMVWNPKAPTEWRGWSFTAGSSAPYLSESTGAFWQSLQELDRALARVRAGDHRFHPRDWVLAHMTDAVCARRLFATIEEVSRVAVVP
jgi:hypothetical protein